jgi:outer membrane protein assembly factor BamB
MRPAGVLLLFLFAAPAAAADGPIHQWQLDAEHYRDDVFKAVAGPHDAIVVGPVRFAADKPKALILSGNSKEKHRVAITGEIDKAGLPTKAITVETWVRIDRPQEWGAMIGAFQHNGSHQKGWLLGFQQSQFFFAVAGKGGKKLTYLKARTLFQPGYWYHVVGTYDGSEQRLYVDGQLSATSKEQTGVMHYPARAFYTIGAYHDDDELYTMAGQLEQVSVFDRALTTEQVATRFQERKDRFPDMDVVRPSVTDWPSYLRDSRRTGISDEELKLPLKLQWTYRARHAPNPAWPEEAKNDYWHNLYNLADRVTYDCAFHVVAVGERVFFGSSADDKVYCLDAATGRERWTYFTEGPVRLAPVVIEDRLLVGSDDGSVYCLNTRDGALLWSQRLAPSERRIPGNGRLISAWPVRTDVLIDDGKAFACAGVFPSWGVYQATLDPRDGKVLDNQTLGVTAQGYLERAAGKLFISTGRNPAGAFLDKLKRRGKEVDKEVKNLGSEYPYAFIGSGGLRFGGGDGKIAAFRVSDGSKVWSAAVEGKVWSLAVARGRLLASTDKGHVYCFSAEGGDPRTVASAPPVEPPYPDAKTRERYAAAAEWVLRTSGVTRGYCLVLGSGDGRLVYELAKRSDLQVIGREPDAGKATVSRRVIDAAGLYGNRVSIHHGALDTLPYSEYLFNLVVSDALVDDRFTGSRDEAQRVLRPCGGVALFGKNERDIVRRAPLAGSGEWSHMYGDTANTACSGDQRVNGPLQLLWFGKPGARSMIDRHHRTAAPLFKNGRLFVPGEDRVIGVDAYNGTILWDREKPKSRRVVVFKDCSYLAADDERLYVAAADSCSALNALTGRTERVFPVPGDGERKQEWGFVARSGDLLLGSAVKPGSSRRAQSNLVDRTETYYDLVPVVGSERLFALDPRDGTVRWSYQPKGLILNPTLTIADGSVYFIESGNPQTLKQEISRARLPELLGKASLLVALDLRSGAVRWSKPGPFEALQHNVYLAAAQGRLVVAGSRNSGNDKETATVLYDVQVFDAKTGERRWKHTHDSGHKIGGDHGEQDQHPVIVGTKLYCEPKAYDLLSGEPIEWNWPFRKRGGCGNISASATSFFFRHDSVAMFDLTKGEPRQVTTETRPGCWINLIPAGGLLLVPEASSGCTCNYSVQTSFALVPETPVRDKQK